MAPLNDDYVGYWGQPTSTLDWCENNYEVSYYIAEFWNTVTNLSMIIPPIWGMCDAYRQGFEKRFVILYLFLLLTGIGSWMFHMTLLYEMQLMDELPMVWGSSYMVYSLYEVRIPKNEGSKAMAVLMGSYSVLVTVVYLQIKDPIFHQMMYGVLVFTLLAMDLHLNICQYSKAGVKVFIAGFFMYLGGFMLWNVDNLFCSQLTSLRSQYTANGLRGLAQVTQLHGWWHLLAGYATYLHILSCIHHRQRFLKDECTFHPSWIGIGVTRGKKKTL